MKKSKRLLFAAILLAMPLCAGAQVSEIIEFPSPSTYKAIKTIVRNFNEYYDIIAVYGYDTIAYYEDTIAPRTMFYKRKLSTGEVTRICILDGGYCVNDFRFVRLKKLISNGVEDYCCFCGTHSELDGYWTIPYGNVPPQYIVDTVKRGFAGFFSMDDARWENPGSTVKVRDIERTEELYRLTCYAEKFGAYWTGQQTFQDNAVMDIIGKPIADETNGARSCLSRVKFYPIYPGGNNGTLWDVDIRYSNLNDATEIMLDITGTEDFTVTASQFEDDYHRLILRYSKKENVLYANGLELSSTVYYLMMPDIHSGNPLACYELPVRLCETVSNNFAVSFGVQDMFSAIYTLQYCAVNPGLSPIRAIKNTDRIHLKDLAYLPNTKKTAMLVRHDIYNTESMICINDYSNAPTLSCVYLYNMTNNFQSLVAHYNGTDDRMSFGGVHALLHRPAKIGSQIDMPSYDETNTCLERVNSDVRAIKEIHEESELLFQIKEKRLNEENVITKELFFLRDNQKIICIKEKQ